MFYDIVLRRVEDQSVTIELAREERVSCSPEIKASPHLAIANSKLAYKAQWRAVRHRERELRVHKPELKDQGSS